MTAPAPQEAEPESTARHLRTLHELAELATTLARAAAEQALAACREQAAEAADRPASRKGPDPFLRFTHLSREVRQTLAQEARLRADSHRREAGEKAGAIPQPPRQAPKRHPSAPARSRRKFDYLLDTPVEQIIEEASARLGLSPSKPVPQPYRPALHGGTSLAQPSPAPTG